MIMRMYCESGNFRESFICANSDFRHIYHNKNSRLGLDLPILVNGRVISPFSRDYFHVRNFAIVKFRENKVLAKIFEFTVNIACELSKDIGQPPYVFICKLLDIRQMFWRTVNTCLSMHEYIYWFLIMNTYIES